MTPFTVARFEAGADGSLERVVLDNAGDGEDRTIDIEGAFIAIGHRPNSDIVEGQVDMDEDGYVEVEGRSTRTQPRRVRRG